jgi:membrane fusion protein, multidrug efflux system
VSGKAITAKEGALVQGCETYGFWLGLIGLFLAGCSQPTADPPPAPPPPAVTVSQPIDKEVLEWDEYTGRLEAVETVDVRARVSGYLEKVNFKDGSKVQKGDLLFVIDPRPYQAELNRAEAELQRVRARLELAKNDLARAERLFRKRAISEEELDTRTKGLRESEATVNSAAAAVQIARLNVEFTQVRAPISGRISRELVTVGNLVNGGAGEATVLATIVSIDPIYVYIDADERAVLKYRRLAREGTRVSAREVQIPIELALADEEGFPHKGVIDYVEPRLDSNTGTVRGRGVFANPDDQLGPGFFARVRVPGSGQYQALLITDHAIATDQSQKFVLVVNDQNVAEYRAVKLGPRIGGLRVITEGLKPGDWVVVNGLQRVRPGMPVKPQRAPMPTQPEMAQTVSFAPPPPQVPRSAEPHR